MTLGQGNIHMQLYNHNIAINICRAFAPTWYMEFGEIGHQLGGLSNFSEFILASSQCKVGDSRWMISSILRK